MAVTLHRAVAAVRPSAGCHTVEFECGHPAVGESISPQDARRVSQMRRIGRAALRRWGFHRTVDEAELVISELITNAIQNGCGSVGFSVSFEGATVRIEVTDGSTSQPSVRRQHDLYAESGRGMLLVDQIASRWGTSADGTRTRCELQGVLGAGMEPS
ncbi:ATP-binding protein [Streptomyces katsurahamanus]|uniref:ATP-binding protein n=2 Tax=Streptomyces katsurahamanus TaxID=2577098 RepID=A0ABW9NRY4_9ACTN|nr:ATP-binding protein [Streptomyces katsurahamanus]